MKNVELQSASSAQRAVRRAGLERRGQGVLEITASREEEGRGGERREEKKRGEKE